ncbi:class F sortase [Streptomyces sp. NPDC088725]|uniref:class F sortase n=1 Tax=Streptomyces sp. NPDC088725 TaxID=3365873 RepID=UPI00381B77EC
MTVSVTASLVTGVVWACGDPPADAPPVTAAATAAGGPVQAAGTPASHVPLPPSPATKIAIPGIVIEAPVIGLGLDPQGHLETPPLNRPRVVGWYQRGPSPGEAGTAVIVGHRDTRTGPAIFLNLNALHPGDAVRVTRTDRRTAVFTVDSVRTYDKEAFPDDKVYGDTGRPELRLLTCGGRFDRKIGYAANVVVFAHLTDVKQA